MKKGEKMLAAISDIEPHGHASNTKLLAEILPAIEEKLALGVTQKKLSEVLGYPPSAFREYLRRARRLAEKQAAQATTARGKTAVAVAGNLPKPVAGCQQPDLTTIEGHRAAQLAQFQKLLNNNNEE